MDFAAVDFTAVDFAAVSFIGNLIEALGEMIPLRFCLIKVQSSEFKARDSKLEAQRSKLRKAHTGSVSHRRHGTQIASAAI